jgi:hypothetical protein
MPLNNFFQFYAYGILASVIFTIISWVAGSIEQALRHNKNPLSKDNQTTLFKEFQKRSLNLKLFFFICALSWIGVIAFLSLIIRDIRDIIQKKPAVKITFE